MFRFKPVISKNLPAGFTCLGTVDMIPGDKIEAYFGIDFAFIFWHRKVAWRVV